jgi:hypothetical protein
MTDLKHIGVLGMHWGHRKGSSGSPSKGKVSIEKTQHKKMKSFNSKDILTGKNVARGILLAYGALALQGAVSHLMKNPIRVEVDYTRWTFKSRNPVEPFFSALIKKRTQKLLTG